MSKAPDRIGQVYGVLMVIGDAKDGKHLTRCTKCGYERVVGVPGLRTAKSRKLTSCMRCPKEAARQRIDEDKTEHYYELGDGWFRGNHVKHDPCEKLMHSFIFGVMRTNVNVCD